MQKILNTYAHSAWYNKYSPSVSIPLLPCPSGWALPTLFLHNDSWRRVNRFPLFLCLCTVSWASLLLVKSSCGQAVPPIAVSFITKQVKTKTVAGAAPLTSWWHFAQTDLPQGTYQWHNGPIYHYCVTCCSKLPSASLKPTHHVHEDDSAISLFYVQHFKGLKISGAGWGVSIGRAGRHQTDVWLMSLLASVGGLMMWLWR